MILAQTKHWYNVCSPVPVIQLALVCEEIEKQGWEPCHIVFYGHQVASTVSLKNMPIPVACVIARKLVTGEDRENLTVKI